ncbi:MAG: hypothetical protein R3F37_09115 [Candidatus Competibacteraceae bacterium]
MHPRLVIALAAVQLAVPALSIAPHWLWLAALHGVLLMLVGYGLFAFVRCWVRNWFCRATPDCLLRRRLVDSHRGGVVHSSDLGVSGPLACWLFRPFLTIISGLLFLVDAAFKEVNISCAVPLYFRFVRAVMCHVVGVEGHCARHHHADTERWAVAVSGAI